VVRDGYTAEGADDSCLLGPVLTLRLRTVSGEH
jgi:hypothetical protein